MKVAQWCFTAQEGDDNARVSRNQSKLGLVRVKGCSKYLIVCVIKLLNVRGLRLVRYQGIWSQREDAKAEGLSENGKTKDKRVKL